MSLLLYVHKPERRRFRSREKARNLIHTCEPPESPATQDSRCDAIETDGRRCHLLLSTEDQTWCSWHLREQNDLSTRWEKLQIAAEKIVVSDVHMAKQKVLKLRLAVELRRRIRERFHTRGIDTVDFIEWIAKLEKEVRTLANMILSTCLTTLALAHVMLIPSVSNLNRKLLPDTPGGLKDNNLSEQIMILQSPLKPAIPIGSLQGIDDGTILVLKHFSTDLCADAIRRLYHILPDLHFSSQLSDSPVQDDTVGDTGAEIVCAWFRIMILNDSEADALERATRCRSIGEYLSGCQASQLETYCDFFEKAWRPHAVQYLRVAICAQTLAGGDIKTVRLLGGDVPSTSEGLRMTKPCWDILSVTHKAWLSSTNNN